MSIKDLAKLSSPDRIEVFEGLDAYIAAVTKRIEVAVSPIRQIINGDVVAKFHAKTDYLVHEIIKQRVEKEIWIKNFIRLEDSNKEIEVSNKTQLKETKILPKNFKNTAMVASFGEYLSMTNMDEKDTFGVIIKDKLLVENWNSMFDAMWENAEVV